MGYLIAVASSDKITVDEHFGKIKQVHIVSVEEGNYSFLGIRNLENEKNDTTGEIQSGCNTGHGCGSHDEKSAKIKDCRALLCSHCGPGASKYLNKHHISVFAIETTVSKALESIIAYYENIDQHTSLRKKLTV